MSLLRKLRLCDDFFKDKADSKKLDAATTTTTTTTTLSTLSAIAAVDVNEWAAEKDAELTMLRDWLAKQPHLPQNVTNEQFLAFLHSCGDSVEQTKTKVDNHFTMRTHAPEVFAERSLASKEFLQALRVARLSPLRTRDGTVVLFFTCEDKNAENYNFTWMLRAGAMALDAMVRYWPREEGIVAVLDMRNTAVAHVVRTNVAMVKKLVVFCQSALPVRLRAVHVINAFPLVQQIQSMVNPFLSAENRKMVHVHMADSMDTFYKVMPRKHLPRDYGGEGPSLEELHGTLVKMMHEQREHLSFLETQVVNESKRAGKPKSSSDVFGVEGSFRRLEFD